MLLATNLTDAIKILEAYNSCTAAPFLPQLLDALQQDQEQDGLH